ncbi:28039_t:CDS:2 [Gigaspora margarita]|uniref:28039_t:CDS:1 n=1 Tax=Gigaspora margarita TaxID=4874 RepID=A0ABN7VSJ8_GIGMA|nr:28039_t:CDS:2 [Gigaspora margarita]
MPRIESVVAAVVISESTRVRGLRFEVDIVEMLRRVTNVIHRGELKARRGHCFSSERSSFLVSGLPIVDELLGVLIRTQQPNGTIGIVVAPSMNNFTPGAIDAAIEIAELSTYPIIVTGKAQLPKYLLNAVLSKLHNQSYTFVRLP